MSQLAARLAAAAPLQRLRAECAGERLAVGVAVSGGADSVALLRLTAECLGKRVPLAVVHVNHGLRAEESEQDEAFVRALAAELGLECYGERADTQTRAKADGKGIEAAARELRREFFERLVAEGKVQRILTAHTLDDQAETVLLRLIRGTGTSGLRGIHSELTTSFPDGSLRAAILRPLLAVRRSELRAYLQAIGQSWREDSSNLDHSFTRNRVRHELMPLLEERFNPEVKVRLAELAEIAAEEERWIAPQVAVRWRGQSAHTTSEPHRPPTGTLELPVAELAVPRALQRRVLRQAGKELGLTLSLAKIDRILALSPDSPATVDLGGWQVKLWSDALRFVRQRPSSNRENSADSPFEYALPVPGELVVAETRTIFRVEVVSDDGKKPVPAGAPWCLIPLEAAEKGIILRNWRTGDRFHAAFSKGPKKVKELLQTMHLSAELKTAWPVILCGGEIVWGRGFPPSAACLSAESAKCAVKVSELPRSEA